MRRCLLGAFTLAAEAEQWQLLSLEQAQAAASPMCMDGAGSMPSPRLLDAPEDCMTSPQALMMSASPNDAWQPGRLREVMQVPGQIWHLERSQFCDGPLHPRRDTCGEPSLQALIDCCICYLEVPDQPAT